MSTQPIDTVASREACYGCWLVDTGTPSLDWGFAAWSDEAERTPAWYDGDTRTAYGIRIYWAAWKASIARNSPQFDEPIGRSDGMAKALRMMQDEMSEIARLCDAPNPDATAIRRIAAQFL